VIKLVSANDAFLQKRFTVDVRELNELYETGQSCQIHLGHTFNWEWGQLVLARLTKYKIMVVYMPITSSVLERLFYKLRTRSGNVFPLFGWVDVDNRWGWVAGPVAVRPADPGGSRNLSRVIATTQYALGPGVMLDGELGYTWFHDSGDGLTDEARHYHAFDVAIGSAFTF